MKMKKPTVTIGIAAYNEEGNIKKLLRSLLKQNAVNFKLKEILIVSDGSTDKTNSIVKSVKNRLIKLFINKKRLGKNKTLNKIVKKTSSDILVLFDADILPKNEYCLSWLVTPILIDENVGLTSGKLLAIRTLNKPIGRIIANAHEMKRRLFELHGSSNNVYLCSGPIRAFAKKLYKKINWPNDVPEDAYSYFFAIKNKSDFVYIQKAVTYFQPSTTLDDHAKQSLRFISGKKVLEKYFDKKIIMKEYSLAISTTLLAILVFAIKRPFSIISYIFITFYISMFKRLRNIDHSRFDTANAQKS